MLQSFLDEVPSTLAGCRWRSERCRPRVPGVLVQAIPGPWVSLRARLFGCSFFGRQNCLSLHPGKTGGSSSGGPGRGNCSCRHGKVRSQVLASPLVQRLPGRPRIKRIRRQEEDRPRRVAFCSFCGRRGHNIRTCPENYAKVIFLFRSS